MSKPFNKKTAYELEQEMHRDFNGSIEEIAYNYNRTPEQYFEELMRKRRDLTGYYRVKSPYHNKTFYLPFIISHFSEVDNAFGVFTVEYKGWKRYKYEAYYTEETIQKYLDTGLIEKVAGLNDIEKPKQVYRLASLYNNAKEPLNLLNHENRK